MQEPLLEFSPHQGTRHTKEGIIPIMILAKPLLGSDDFTCHDIDDPATRKQNGIYYTPSSIAQTMVNWVIRSPDDIVLEPCFGKGVFLHALREIHPNSRSSVYGIEMMNLSYSQAIESGLLASSNAILGDFINITPFKVNAVIGNPPYVRLRSLDPAKERETTSAAEKVLGSSIDPAGNLWLAFLLHATQFLSDGGRLAFVLPYEFTHVRYAKRLWRYLGNHFGLLKVQRVKERVFPELLQEVVILLADNKGETTNAVMFEVYEKVSHFIAGDPVTKREFTIEDVIHERPFVRALIPKALDELLEERVYPHTIAVPEFCTFNIGYVSGNKQFFHPAADTEAAYGLSQSSLRSSVVSTRQIRGAGLYSSSIGPSRLSKLFYPHEPLSRTDIDYIEKGEREGVNNAYKCSNRKPWYRVPDVRVPDLLLSVFRETPSLLVNDGKLVASNSILCGFLQQPASIEPFIAAWYTSLTLLNCELQVHSLGGGIPIFIPGELAKVRIPYPCSLPTGHLPELHAALLNENDPYRVGDSVILEHKMRLSPQEISLIWEGIAVLSGWRNAHRAQHRLRVGSLDEHVKENMTLLESFDHSLDKVRDREFMLSASQ